jgi:hypothetical protein
MYSKIPTKLNIYDSEILYAVDKFSLSSSVIRTVVIIITIELRHMLKNAYFDIRMPSKILVTSRQHPMIMAFFIVYRFIGGGVVCGKWQANSGIVDRLAHCCIPAVHAKVFPFAIPFFRYPIIWSIV